VAPSLIPHTPGERVTTDRRDAMPLARLMRSGARPPVSVPPVEDAAIRDLCRARAEALCALKAATWRLNAFWLRQALRSPGQAPWGPAPLRWLSAVGCATPAHQLVCQEDVRAVTAHPERLQRLEPALHAQGQTWR
jgi:hypothetical protein